MDDRHRFDALVRPVLPDLYRFALRLTRDGVTAEDLLQQALLQGLRHLSQLHDDGAFRVWQCRVLYTTFLNARAQSHRFSGESMLDEEEGADPRVVPFERPGPEQETQHRQLGARIAGALDRLPADQREAVWLVDGQGFKFGEAAQVLGVPAGTVASRVARGRLALRIDLAAVAAEEGVGR
jgi:RNA polymerase sigma-70 factor (ECF subfamily)